MAVLKSQCSAGGLPVSQEERESKKIKCKDRPNLSLYSLVQQFNLINLPGISYFASRRLNQNSPEKETNRMYEGEGTERNKLSYCSYNCGGCQVQNLRSLGTGNL